MRPQTLAATGAVDRVGRLFAATSRLALAVALLAAFGPLLIAQPDDRFPQWMQRR
jgi:hypothetical protein